MLWKRARRPKTCKINIIPKQRDYEITVFSDALSPTADLVHVKLDAHLIRNPTNILFKIIKVIFYLSEKVFAFNIFRDWVNSILYGYSRLYKQSVDVPFEFVVCHDIYLLDFALQMKKKAETKNVFLMRGNFILDSLKLAVLLNSLR